MIKTNVLVILVICFPIHFFCLETFLNERKCYPYIRYYNICLSSKQRVMLKLLLRDFLSHVY